MMATHLATLPDEIIDAAPMRPQTLDGPIYVVGLGRCGSSAVMAMLAAAGVPIWVDEFTDPRRFETLRTRHDPWMWVDDLGNRAVKAMCPWSFDLPDYVDPSRVVLMIRDVDDQTDSQVTGMRERYGHAVDRDLMFRYFSESTAKILGLFRGSLVIKFHRLIDDPRCQALRLCDRFDLDRRKVGVMARAVWKRPARHVGTMLDKWGD